MGFIMSKTKRLWLRLGDTAEYDSFDTIEEIAEEMVACGVSTELTRVVPYGLTDMLNFKDWNYISLYYGDDDAQNPESIFKKDLDRLNEIILNN